MDTTGIPRPTPTGVPPGPTLPRQPSVPYRSGWKSTKLHLSLITMGVLTVVYVFVVARTGEPAGFGEYCIAMISAAGIYSGSRVAESFAQRPARPPPPKES